MSLYFWINLLSISIPFIVSFHPRIALHKKFYVLIPSILVAMIPYIVWDVYFTEQGYWGFNPAYLSGVYIMNLPLEEWLFFICIPFACVFTHISILVINPNLKLKASWTNGISVGMLIGFALMGIMNFERAYTVVDMSFGFAILLLVYFFDRELLFSYFITFLFMLIPFFIVNGILTGSGIQDQVVWYNDQQNLGIRIGTIPVEDTVYAFSLILLNLILFRKLSTVFGFRTLEA